MTVHAHHAQKAKQAALTTFDVETGMTICPHNRGCNEHALLKKIAVYTLKKGFAVSLGGGDLLISPDTELIIEKQPWVWNGACWKEVSYV